MSAASDGPERENTPFDDILDALERHGSDGKVAIGTVQDEIGDKALGAFLVLPALLEITPIGGVPAVPTFLAIVIVIVAAQVAVGREHLWLPDMIERRSVAGGKLLVAVRVLRRPAVWIDRSFHNRLTRFTTKPFDRIVALICILLALTVPPLELVPFASTIPMVTIALLGLALLFDDGLLVLVGLGMAIIGMGLVGYQVFT